jgi:hypothetical protein
MIVNLPSRVNDPADPSTRLDWKAMVGVLRGVEDLLEGLVDLRAVGLGERLDAAGCFPDFEGINLNLDGHRGVRRVGGIDRGATLPSA